MAVAHDPFSMTRLSPFPWVTVRLGGVSVASPLGRLVSGV